MLTSTATSFVEGHRPLPVYLFGPRGSGKSHLLTMLRERITDAARSADIEVVVVPEDIPIQSSAEALLQRFDRAASTVPVWATWNQSPPRLTSAPAQPRIVIVEGLDRQLAGLGKQGRRRLRNLLGERPDLFLVASGVTLPRSLTRADEAFYGAFDPHPVGPLSVDEARELLQRASGREADDTEPRWVARRDALVALTGGSPRALVAVGRAVREDQDAPAVDGLLHVLQDFTAHYQLRFRDLSPLAQRLVETMALAPRQLRPSELSEILGEKAAVVSTTCARLESDGVLIRRTAGRVTHFELVEPLFRFWLEYRTAPWERTRVEWLSRLLEALYAPQELAAAWWSSEDETSRAALRQAVSNDPQATHEAYETLIEQVTEAHLANDASEVAERLSRLVELRLDERQLTGLVLGLTLFDVSLLRDRVIIEAIANMGPLREAVRFANDVLSDAQKPRQAFKRLIGRLPSTARPLTWLAVSKTVESTLRALHQRSRPWSLSDREQHRLSQLPFLAGLFSLRGKHASDPPLIPLDVWRSVEIDVSRPDLGDLLNVAMIHGDASLFGRVAGLVSSGRGYLRVCPRPGQTAPDSWDAIARAMDPGGGGHRLTWAASLAHCASETFAALLGRLRETDSVESLRGELELAFVGLGARAPERLAALLAVLNESWQELGARATALVAQLAERERGPLHPELQAVWDSLGLE